jgi:Zn-dependent protease
MLLALLSGIPFAVALISASNKARETGTSAADYVFFAYFLALVMIVVVHELGHLLAGWMVGFHFSSITIGPLSLFMEYGRLRLRLRRTMPAGGYAGMQINSVRRLRRRLLVFTVAGPAANLLSAAAVASFLASVPQPGFWLSTLGDLFWMMSVIIGVVNLLPFRFGTLYLDGARIWMLLSSRAKSRRWFCLSAIGRQSRTGVPPREFRRTWLRAAEAVEDGSVDEFAGNWVAYLAANDRKDKELAASHLERCLRLVSSLGPSLRDVVALEAAVFTAWFQQNASVAEKWFGQVRKVKALPQLMQLRGEIALCCARKAFGPALSRWQDAFAFAEKLPPTPFKNALLQGLLEWRDEIRERERSLLTGGDSTLAIQAGALPT